MTEDIKKKALFLASSRLFGGLPPNDIQKIASIAEFGSFKKKSTLFLEGQPADLCYFVLSGKVKIYKTGAMGKEQILRSILPGESFAEAAMFAGETYPANAVAVVDTEVIFFPRVALLTIVRKNPELAMRLLGSLARFCRHFVKLLEDLALRSVPSRVAAFILARGHDKMLRPGETVNLGISKGELASRLGIASETLSRTLKKFKDDGIITINRRELKILRPDKLRHLVSGSYE